MSVKQRWLLSALAVYGPYAAMAAYAVGWLTCSHCKQTACMLFPCGPGLIVAEIIRRLMDLPRLTNAIWFGSAGLISLVLVVGLSALFRFVNSRWTFVVGGVILALSSVAALITLGLIRA